MPTKPLTAKDYVPENDFILLLPEIEPEKSDGGIIIPEQARKTLDEGEIIATGPRVSEHLKLGMFIVFNKSSEYRLKLDDGTLVFAVSEINVILHRHPTKALFPAK